MEGSARCSGTVVSQIRMWRRQKHNHQMQSSRPAPKPSSNLFNPPPITYFPWDEPNQVIIIAKQPDGVNNSSRQLGDFSSSAAFPIKSRTK